MSTRRLLHYGLAALAASLIMAGAGMSAGKGKVMKHRVLVKAAQTNQAKAARKIIRNQKDLDALWKQLGKTRQPQPKTPAVDFKKEVVIALFMGLQRTGGFSVEIVKVEQTKKAVLVHVKTKRPGPGDIVTQALTTPGYVAAIPKTGLPIKFVEVK